MSLHLSNRGLKHLILALVATFTFSSSLFADKNLDRQLAVVERLIPSSAVQSTSKFEEATRNLGILANYMGTYGGTGRYYLIFQKLVDRLASVDRLIKTGNYDNERLKAFRNRIAGILHEVSKSARHLKSSTELNEDEKTEELNKFRASLQVRLNNAEDSSTETIGSVILGLSFVDVRPTTIAKVAKLYQTTSDAVLREEIETSFEHWQRAGVISDIPSLLRQKTTSVKVSPIVELNDSPSSKKEAKESASLAGLDLFFDAKAAINTRLLAAQLISAQLSEILPSMPDSEIADLQLNLMVTIAEQSEPQDILRAAALMLLQTSSYTPDKTFNREFLSFVLLAGQNSYKDVIISQAIATYAQNILRAEKSSNTEINHDFFVSCAEAYKTGK